MTSKLHSARRDHEHGHALRLRGFVPSERISRLKAAYLDARSSITIDRALAFTLVAMEQPDLPPQLRIARSFSKACETAPLLIQDDELIVGHPCGRPRAGAPSPDIA